MDYNEDALRKPPEMYSLIENFCLGFRRLEIFGRPSSLRRGWVTVGDIDDAAYELEKVNGKAWDREWYDADIKANAHNGRFVVANSPGMAFSFLFFYLQYDFLSYPRIA